MNLFIVFSVYVVMGLGAAMAIDVPDPLQREKADGSAIHNMILYVVELDMNNDGRKDMLIAEKPNKDVPRWEQTPGWSVYLKNPAGKSFTIEPDWMIPEFDPSRIYVGYIEEIQAYGLLTRQDRFERKAESSSQLYAYVMQEGSLKKIAVGERFSTSEGHPIDVKYLVQLRTRLQVKEVK